MENERGRETPPPKTERAPEESEFATPEASGSSSLEELRKHQDARDQAELIEARRDLNELIQADAKLREASPEARQENPKETVQLKDRAIEIEYVPREAIEPAFGYYYHPPEDRIAVRSDLPPRVKRFVRSHELHHAKDKAKWGGVLGSEFRASFFPGLKDPVGLMATIGASLNPERLRLYWRLYGPKRRRK